jgi:hypothetical protein
MAERLGVAAPLPTPNVSASAAKPRSVPQSG